MESFIPTDFIEGWDMVMINHLLTQVYKVCFYTLAWGSGGPTGLTGKGTEVQKAQTNIQVLGSLF
jgi:hypothetical protein